MQALPTADKTRIIDMDIDRFWAAINHHYETCGFCTAYTNCPVGERVVMDLENATGMPVVSVKVA